MLTWLANPARFMRFSSIALPLLGAALAGLYAFRFAFERPFRRVRAVFAAA